MSNLLERLRATAKDWANHGYDEADTAKEAADEIERLEAELAETQDCELDLMERDIKQCERIERLTAENERLEAEKERQQFCVWEDCDQEPSYCEGHAHELVNPLQRKFAPPALEINEHGVMTDKSQDADWLRARFFEQSIEIERLQTRVDELEGVRRAVEDYEREDTTHARLRMRKALKAAHQRRRMK